MNDIKIELGYEYIDEVKRLMRKYIEELNRNLDFQNIHNELEYFQQKYAEPKGRLLVALNKENHVVS